MIITNFIAHRSAIAVFEVQKAYVVEVQNVVHQSLWREVNFKRAMHWYAILESENVGTKIADFVSLYDLRSEQGKSSHWLSVSLKSIGAQFALTISQVTTYSNLFN